MQRATCSTNNLYWLCAAHQCVIRSKATIDYQLSLAPLAIRSEVPNITYYTAFVRHVQREIRVFNKFWAIAYTTSQYSYRCTHRWSSVSHEWVPKRSSFCLLFCRLSVEYGLEKPNHSRWTRQRQRSWKSYHRHAAPTRPVIISSLVKYLY